MYLAHCYSGSENKMLIQLLSLKAFEESNPKKKEKPPKM